MSKDVNRGDWIFEEMNAENCGTYLCQEFGSCEVGGDEKGPGKSACLCDLWHTGQLCEHYVIFPLAVTVTCTLFVSCITFFCWYSSLRFRKKKIHIPKRRVRFADYLHKKQKKEKIWLTNTVNYMAQNLKKSRDIPFDEKIEEEMEKSKKEVKKQKEEKPQPSTKGTTKTELVEELRDVEKAKAFLATHDVSTKTITKLKTEEDPPTTSGTLQYTQNQSGPDPHTTSGTATSAILKPSPSDSNMGPPADAPEDWKKREKMKKEVEKKEAANVEMKSKELNKKRKK